MKKLILALTLTMSFTTFANISNDVPKNNEQVFVSRCYEIRIQTEYLKNWVATSPATYTTLNKFCTQAESLVWSDEVSAHYASLSNFNFSTGTGTLYTILAIPDEVTITKCFK
ncbi:hypothetical protein QNH98_18810 [Myroides sp. mNGS23_01]|nr:hypothetical protein [Myroides sp. mNGS23_01]WHT38980.1 hypothetical protein QNH98_18810 [Myroides sp. mNGS23_01]